MKKAFLICFSCCFFGYAFDDISYYSPETIYEDNNVYYSKKTHNPIMGKLLVLYPNGNIHIEGSFVNGVPEGTENHYYENKTLKAKIFFKNGLKEGEGIYYYPNGKIQAVVPFKSDRPDGLALEYYENGDVQVENMYQGDKLIRISYTPKGELMGEGEFYKGKPVQVKIYQPNGQIGLIDNYDENNHLKRWYYDENGQFYQEVKFENNKAVDGYFLNKKGEKIKILPDILKNIQSKIVQNTKKD